MVATTPEPVVDDPWTENVVDIQANQDVHIGQRPRHGTRPQLHCVSLPHTLTTHEFDWCAYTAKLRKFGDMMTAEGWDVIIYAGEENEAACAEHVVVVPEDDRQRWFGTVDWSTQMFDGWGEAEWWDVMNTRIIWAMRERMCQGDMICVIGGLRQQAIAQAFPDNRTIEPFVGYEGVFTEFCAWESYAWMHYMYGRLNIGDGRNYDAVIPNYFDPADFDATQKREDYLLFIGRMIHRKGPMIAAEVARQSGRRLILAGQGDPTLAPGGEYVGIADVETRKELMGKAAAVIVPTIYVEPFGGVAVEAMMSGTPVITQDFGAFTETVSHGQTGWRGRTIPDMVEGVEKLDKLWAPGKIARETERRYSMNAIGPQFTAWLERLDDLPGFGYYHTRGRKPLEQRYGVRR